MRSPLAAGLATSGKASKNPVYASRGHGEPSPMRNTGFVDTLEYRRITFPEVTVTL